jgi:hypothetical protein
MRRPSERSRQYANGVHRLARSAFARTVGDLVAAARAVGDDQRSRFRLAHRRQQRKFRHSHRHVVVRGLKAERACHSAAARLDHLDGEPGDELQHGLRRRDRIERLLMAVAVQQRARFG